MWTVEVKDDVKHKLKQIPNPDKERIKQAVIKLRDEPETLDIKKLVGRKGYRLRVGKWRLLMDMDNTEQSVYVYKLAPRGEAYKD